MILLYTSAEAAKLLRKLTDALGIFERYENQSSTFHAALGENPEDVRPEYDYEKTQNAIIDAENKIRTVKHAINEFNLSHVVPEFNMTIDQLLVYIPQLTKRKQKLYSMQSRLPKSRESNFRGSNIIDYCITNYDIKKAHEDYIKVSDELAAAQTALDVINNSEKFEINFEN